MEIITVTTLQSYLGADASLATADQLQLYVDLANGLVTEAWANPVAPAPAWVSAVAFEAAARPVRNPRGLASLTKHVGEASRTERLSDRAARAGVYLTDDEKTDLRGGGPTKPRRRFGVVRTPLGY